MDDDRAFLPAGRRADFVAVRLAGADATRVLRAVDDSVEGAGAPAAADGLVAYRDHRGPRHCQCARGLTEAFVGQVAQPGRDLAAVNEELRREIAEHRREAATLRKAVRELQRSAADRAAILAVSQELGQTGSFSWRPATDEMAWSEQAYRIYGYDTAVPMTLAMIAARVHPEDLPALSDLIERARIDEGGFDCEHRLWMPDRSVKYIRITAHAARDREGDLRYIGAVRDVTECRRSELGEIRLDLAHLARVTTLGVLAASIAHEVSQPLSGMLINAGTTLWMLDGASPNIDGVRETVLRTIRDCRRASEVVSRLRALFAGKGMTTGKVDINEAAREAIALTSGELQRCRVYVRSELLDDLPPVTGDYVQIQQVILNLILNAADAMSCVEGRPRQLVLTTRRDLGDRVRLAVQDTGSGFAPESVKRLFEPFFTTKRGGMGIGLSVSRTIIESHGGVLSATMNDGPGATFSFTIPRRQDCVD